MVIGGEEVPSRVQEAAVMGSAPLRLPSLGGRRELSAAHLAWSRWHRACPVGCLLPGPSLVREAFSGWLLSSPGVFLGCEPLWHLLWTLEKRRLPASPLLSSASRSLGGLL